MQYANEASQNTASPPRIPLTARLLVVTGAALLISVAVTHLSGSIWGEDLGLVQHIANAVGVFVLAVPLVILARRYLDRRRMATLGLRTAMPAWRNALYGAGTFLIPATIGLGVCLAAGWLEIRLVSSVAELLAALLLLVVLVFVYEAFPEELIFRGYLYRNLTAALPPWIAIGVQAALFAVWGTSLWIISHGWDVLVERAVLFFAMGIVVGGIRHVSGSLWAAIGFHLAFQVVMQAFSTNPYVDIEVSDDAVFTLATAVVSFCAALTIAGVFWTGTHNWKTPIPEGAVGHVESANPPFA